MSLGAGMLYICWAGFGGLGVFSLVIEITTTKNPLWRVLCFVWSVGVCYGFGFILGAIA